MPKPTTITYNGSELVVQADGRVPISYTPTRFYALSPDIDLHETAAKAIACQGEPVAVLGRASVRRPRNANPCCIAM